MTTSLIIFFLDIIFPSSSVKNLLSRSTISRSICRKNHQIIFVFKQRAELINHCDIPFPWLYSLRTARMENIVFFREYTLKAKKSMCIVNDEEDELEKPLRI